MLSHLDPVEDAARYYDAQAQREEDAERSAQEVEADFLAACRGNLDAVATFAAPLYSYSQKRHVTRLVHEVMAESLDYGDAPSMKDAMQLIAHVANGAPDAQAKAQALLNLMAQAWARFNNDQ